MTFRLMTFQQLLISFGADNATDLDVDRELFWNPLSFTMVPVEQDSTNFKRINQKISL